MTAIKVEALERALDILDAFGEGKDALSLKELAEATGLYKSRILRFTASLVDRGYMLRDADGRYRLGPKLWRLGALYRRSFDLGDTVRPILRGIVAEINESASFYVRDGDARICLFRQESTHAIRHHVEEGARLPLERGVGGRVLLAFAGEKGKIYDRIRADGYMNAPGERDRDTASVAVPVYDSAGNLAGALALAGLQTRFSERQRERAVQVLLRASKALGPKLARSAE